MSQIVEKMWKTVDNILLENVTYLIKRISWCEFWG